ncbi:MAG TPA: hypothetical protein VFM68_01125 [Candidatus Saccharimonadales bacterium]|nr:hypothetical protein [Candidatus Saccharimonadales bacterium]
MGLQTGSELARTSKPIIDPKTLEIAAYELTGSLLNTHPSLLRIADVREFSDIGLIVDSSDEFVGLDDIIKLREVYDLHFTPVGMMVIDEKRQKLGKVDSYTIETGAFLIQQLVVKRPLLKSLNDARLLIHRTQITEINDTEIVVHSQAEAPEPVMNAVQNVYTNPFRSKGPQTEQINQSIHHS